LPLEGQGKQDIEDYEPEQAADPEAEAAYRRPDDEKIPREILPEFQIFEFKGENLD